MSSDIHLFLSSFIIVSFQPTEGGVVPVETAWRGEGDRQLLDGGPSQELRQVQGGAGQDHQQGGGVQVSRYPR